MKTCRKLGISFFTYLGDRLGLNRQESSQLRIFVLKHLAPNTRIGRLPKSSQLRTFIKLHTKNRQRMAVSRLTQLRSLWRAIYIPHEIDATPADESELCSEYFGQID